VLYGGDPSEPVRRFRAWEREFERRQALRREPLDAPPHAALSPWSLLTGLMSAMREATGASTGSRALPRGRDLGLGECAPESLSRCGMSTTT
jgi:hypothetical protein